MRKMKSIIIWLLAIGLIASCFWIIVSSKQIKFLFERDQSVNNVSNIQNSKIFNVYYKNKIIKSFTTKKDAIYYGNKFKYTYIKESNKEEWIWNNFKPFILFEDSRFINDYNSFSDAVFFAKEKEKPIIYYKNNKNVIWSDSMSIRKKVLLDIPVILQNPELPRGCEVTSLAMLLNYAGIEVDKNELAGKIKKDKTPLYQKEERIYFGNPNDGFVGDMYSLNNPGYGVYNGPIEELMKEYLPNQTINLTGCEFEDLFYFISRGSPVWVITNSTYKILDESEFDIWMTPTGPVEITFSLHAVLITGYDENNIYINDPLYVKQNIKVNKDTFINAWNQMGRQAISYIELEN